MPMEVVIQRMSALFMVYRLRRIMRYNIVVERQCFAVRQSFFLFCRVKCRGYPM